MNIFETKLQQLTTPEIRKALLNNSIPSISHCVGTGKLLGEYGGKALCQVCDIRDKKITESISLIAVFLRSFIVLDDFIRDNGLNISNIKNLQIWLDNIKKEIIRLLSMLTNDPVGLWTKYFSIYEKSYHHFDKDNLYQSILEKCFLMFLPFELEPLQRSRKNEVLRKSMAYYLFSLQLIDDFHDMEEDLLSPKNHNLFLVSVSSEYYQDIINGKSALINAVLDYIEKNLKSLKNLNNDIINDFFSHSLSWIQKRKIEFSNLPFRVIFHDNYEEFRFNDEVVKNLIPYLRVDHNINFEHIRAENMHTIHYNQLCFKQRG